MLSKVAHNIHSFPVDIGFVGTFCRFGYMDCNLRVSVERAAHLWGVSGVNIDVLQVVAAQECKFANILNSSGQCYFLQAGTPPEYAPFDTFQMWRHDDFLQTGTCGEAIER